ncbi:hypothetical protein [Sphingosinicella sp. BN140058]|nr:hypothetical protein [Sphingosinicella sp. BN140058]
MLIVRVGMRAVYSRRGDIDPIASCSIDFPQTRPAFAVEGAWG